MKMTFQLPFQVVFAAALLISAQAQASAKQLSTDFFVTKMSGHHTFKIIAPLSGRIEDRANCEQALTRAVCETEATTDVISNDYSNVQCSASSASFVPALMQIYDEMPERMRISICTLDRIFISDGIPSTAFASSVTDDSGNVTGGYVGMRKATFLAQPTTAQLVTWKEQLAFGGSTQFLSNDPRLVQINYGLKLSTLKADGLFYVLMHELGHLIDFRNNIDSPSGFPTAWSKMSWGSFGAPLADATFYKRDEMCFYNCRHYLAASDAKELYTSLSKSAFITSYAAQTPYEDFAEFWAWRMMEESKSPNYEIVLPGETTLDMNSVFKTNAKVKTKIDFVEQLWNKADLVIDNRVGPSN